MIKDLYTHVIYIQNDIRSLLVVVVVGVSAAVLEDLRIAHRLGPILHRMDLGHRGVVAALEVDDLQIRAGAAGAAVEPHLAGRSGSGDQQAQAPHGSKFDFPLEPKLFSHPKSLTGLHWTLDFKRDHLKNDGLGVKSQPSSARLDPFSQPRHLVGAV